MNRTADDITCRELVELVTDYLDGALEREDRVRFERHLGECEACTTFLEQMRLTIEASGRLSEESIDPAARNALLEAFRGWKRGRG